jgi:c-di-GMP-binding flagellar brake protein YcgR
MDFQIGDYVEIEIVDGYYRGEYPSRIVSIHGHKLILVAPRLAGTLIPVKPNTILVIHVCNDDARYVFDGNVTIAVPDNINRKRRSDVRFAIRLPVELLYFYRNGIPVTAHTLSSLDISAGGIRIEAPEEFLLHTKLKLAIILPDSEEMMAYADVVRTGTLSHPEPGSVNSNWASLKFINMSDNKKKKILKFIYKQQELRVKGLI